MEELIQLIAGMIQHFDLNFADVIEDVVSIFVDPSIFEALNKSFNETPIELPLNFVETFNQNQNLISNSNYITEIQSLKAQSILDINHTFGDTHPVLQSYLKDKLDLISILKTHYILNDVVSMENEELDTFFVELLHYDLNEDSKAFYHKISNVDYQPYLIDRDVVIKTSDTSEFLRSKRNLLISSSSSSSSSLISSSSLLLPSSSSSDLPDLGLGKRSLSVSDIDKLFPSTKNVKRL